MKTWTKDKLEEFDAWLNLQLCAPQAAKDMAQNESMRRWNDKQEAQRLLERRAADPAPSWGRWGA
jgi:predicted ATPase